MEDSELILNSTLDIIEKSSNPVTDILFEQIQVCPIDDHATMGVLNTTELITTK